MQNWDDFRLILALSRAKTLRGAAFELQVNHSTVSRRLAILNTQWDYPVFEQTAGGYRPTRTGKPLLDAAEQFEAIYLRARRKQRAREQALSGPITLSVPPVIGQYLLLDALAGFSTEYPEVQLQIYSSYQYADLDRSEADVVIRGTQNPPDHLVGRRLFAYGLSYYGHRDYLQNTPPEQRRWIGRTDDTHSRSWILNSPFPDVPLGLRMDDIEARHLATIAGHGMSRGACYMGDPEPLLVRLPGAPTIEGIDIWVLTHPDLKNTPRIQALMQHIITALVAKREIITGINAKE
jgi:DNA-binding transcriptional LysR family regulator